MELRIERPERWQGNCKRVSVVSLPTFAGLAPAASAETQTVHSILYQGSYAQAVSNGNPSAQNETSSSVIGNALAWDSQRQMHAELSSIGTTRAESIASPASSLRMLTSVGPDHSESAWSGLASISSNLAKPPVMLVSAGAAKETTAPITTPSSPGMALSILDMKGGAGCQADLRPGQAAEPKTESAHESTLSAPASSSQIFSWASFSSSEPASLNETQAVAIGQSPALRVSLPGQLTSALPLSNEVQMAGSNPGSLLQRTPAGRASAAKPATNSPADQPAVLSPLEMVTTSNSSPVAPDAKPDLPTFDEPTAPRDHALMFQVPAVKTASGPSGNSAFADRQLASSGTNRAGPTTDISSAAGLPAGDATPQSVVDHFSFELSLQPKNPVVPNDPAGAGSLRGDNPGNTSTDAASFALAPRTFDSRRASVDTESDSGASAALDLATDQAAKRGVDPPNAELVNMPAQATDPAGSAAILTVALAPHTIPKNEVSAASISTGPTIVPPETKAPTPQGLVHDVQLRLQGDSGENVSVRLSDRSGQVQISVRSTDQATATTLRQDLSTLSASLEKQGWKTDLSESPAQTAGHDIRDPSNQQPADQQGRQRSSPEWEEPPERKRLSPNDQWADINQQETK